MPIAVARHSRKGRGRFGPNPDYASQVLDHPESGAVRARPHQRFSRELTLPAEEVAAFARAVGDSNPIHFDAEFAASTRFGRPIASGTQTAALLLALTASHFAQFGAMLGLEFWVRFRRPVYAGEAVVLEWLVVSVTPSERLGGDIVDLRGRVRTVAGETAVGAKGRVLVTDRL
jgi:3-hydroxybutyryl-CoA dehydratase